MIKNLLTYIPVVTLAIGLIIGYTKFQARAENTEVKVAEIKAEVKEISKDKAELEKEVEVAKVQQENIQKEVKQVSDKTDKIISLLLDMKKGG